VLDDAPLPCNAGPVALWSDDDELARVRLVVTREMAPRRRRAPAEAVPPGRSRHDRIPELNLDGVERRAAILNAGVSRVPDAALDR
jgi:hypothetical protein